MERWEICDHTFGCRVHARHRDAGNATEGVRWWRRYGTCAVCKTGSVWAKDGDPEVACDNCPAIYTPDLR